jgi:propionaldehyde dehydrogenase
MNEAIENAQKGYGAVRAMTVEQREKIITEIRRLTREEAPIMAEMGVAETGMGKVEHKRLKHILVADKTPGTEDITSWAKTGDSGLTLVEMAPFGVVGAITPSTNPSETVICNSMGMIAAGNGVVFNPHPNAICVSNYAVDLVNRACAAMGGPEILVCSMDKPTLESAAIMQSHPKIRLLVCTGGPGVVKAVLSSGKKAIGAGAGNPPVIVDDTADIEKAAKDIAEKRVKASLCLQILARDEKIEVEDEIVDAKINELREVYKKSKEALKNLKDPNVRQDIKNRLTIEKTLNYLVEVNSK